MNRIVAIVEGPTERAFCQEVLAPYLGALGVFVTAQIVGRPGRKGGVRSWASVRRDVLAALKQDRQRACTTMFDYYGVPADWPAAAKKKNKPFRAAVAAIERAMHDDICKEMGSSFDQTLFLPYLQVHEFEALLFSGPKVLAEVLDASSLESKLRKVVADSGEPEAIDDGDQTHPSKRILALAPDFQKTLHGSIAAQRIGIDRMREGCPNFAKWVARLESLSN